MPRGRPPKPTTLHFLNGDPSKTRRYRTEPPTLDGRPEAPEYLDDMAKKEWEAITTILADMNLLSRADRAALELYCGAYSRYRRAQEQVAKFGEVILSPNKKFPMPSPYATAMNSAFEQMRKMLIEFGLTPASRARMSLPVQEKKSGSKWAGLVA